jgi:hypothetical protein
MRLFLGVKVGIRDQTPFASAINKLRLIAAVLTGLLGQYIASSLRR